MLSGELAALEQIQSDEQVVIGGQLETHGVVQGDSPGLAGLVFLSVAQITDVVRLIHVPAVVVRADHGRGVRGFLICNSRS